MMHVRANEILQKMPLGSSNEGLLRIARVLNLKLKTRTKDYVYHTICRFYETPGTAEILYNALSAFDKEILTCFFQFDMRPLAIDLIAIANKYSFDYKSSRNWGEKKWYSDNSLLHAMLPNKCLPDEFKGYLKSVIPPHVTKFFPSTIEPENDQDEIISREERYKDFDMLIKFINNNSISTTKAGGCMTKANVIKFQALAGYHEIIYSDCTDIDEIRSAGELAVTTGIVNLLKCADIIDIIKDKYTLSKNATQYSLMSMPEKAMFLYNAYLKNGSNHVIDECARVAGVKLKFSKSSYNLSEARKTIVSFLKLCPVNEWIDFEQLSLEILRMSRMLFEDSTGEPTIKSTHYYTDLSPTWNEFEALAINVALMEYLAVIGALDVKIHYYSYNMYISDSTPEVSYFKITELGAYLFGSASEYTEKSPNAGKEKGFMVLPNFDVIISDGPDRMSHELFFDRFATKTTEDKAVTVYKLDFKSMVKALDIGIAIREVNAYCESFTTTPLPDNVKSTLAEWEEKSKRIVVRNAYFISSDDPFLLDELKSYTGMKALSEEKILNALILKPGCEKKAKTIVEKNQRFCIIDN
jgi:hypothetical protein